MKNIILTGMRGTGKSKIGRYLSKKLNRSFIDLDKKIEQEEKKTIREIVALKGWGYFRKKEKYVVRSVSKRKNQIIATGGGTCMDKENLKQLRKNGIIILLSADIEILIKRISQGKNRPSLTNEKSHTEELNEIWEKRKEKYQKAADFTIDVSIQTEDYKKDMEEKCQKIIQEIKKINL